MSLRRTAAALLLAAVALRAAPVAAYFVIELRDGRRLEANFVRSDDEVVHASRPSGEIAIPKRQVLSIEEVAPGRLLQDGGPGGDAKPASHAVDTVEAHGSADDLGERERRVTREIILGHREILFARLRGDDPESIATRRKEIEELEQRRADLREALPSWARGRGRPEAAPGR